MLNNRTVKKIQKFLANKYLPLFLAFMAVLISIPTVFLGWEPLDDLRHRLKLLPPSKLDERITETGMIPENSGKLMTVLHELHSNVYTKDKVKIQKEYGVLPWWTHEDYKASNFRPLDSFTHWLDYRLFPDNPVLIHLHNILWFALVIFLITILYRRFFKYEWLAGLAAVLYLLDDSNYFPAAWIANRNLLIALAFGILTILAHHRWRQNNSTTAGILAAVCLLCSLLATEAGIAAFAYIFAYTLTIEKSSWRRRLLSLLPAIFVIILWRTAYSYLGHGAYTSGFILDPAREPIRFLSAILARGPVLLFAQWTPAPASMFGFLYTEEQIYGWGIAVIFLLTLTILFLPLIIKSRIARFWAIAMLCSTLPICASMPMNRNLLFVAIAAFGLMAHFIEAVMTKQSFLIKTGFRKVAALTTLYFLLLCHIPISAVGRIAQPIIISSMQKKFEETMRIPLPPGIENKSVVFINCPNPYAVSYLPPYNNHHNMPLPKNIRIIATGFNMYYIDRIDEYTIKLITYKGNILQNRKRTTAWSVNFFKSFTESFRDCVKFPINPGEKFELSDFVAEVIQVDKNSMPTEVSYTFDRPLRDASLIWLKWDWLQKNYKPFEVPGLGNRAIVEGPPRRKKAEKQ
jgi:hypothetical protein